MSVENPKHASEQKLNPDFVKKIENSPLLSDDDKTIFILTLEGSKSASIVSPPNQSLLRGEYNEEKFQESLREVEKLADEAGLFHERKDLNAMSEEGEMVMRCAGVFISHDKQVLGELFASFNAKDHERTGELLGYPETATAGYIHESGESPDLPPEIKYSPDMEFAGFQMSKDHWRDEFEVIKKWAGIIRDNAPDLYKKKISVREHAEALKQSDPEEFKKWMENEEVKTGLRYRDPALYNELYGEK